MVLWILRTLWRLFLVIVGVCVCFFVFLFWDLRVFNGYSRVALSRKQWRDFFVSATWFEDWA